MIQISETEKQKNEKPFSFHLKKGGVSGNVGRRFSEAGQ